MNIAVNKRGFGWTLLLLIGVLLVLFWKSLLPGQTLFSNDGPLGRLEANCHLLPGAFTGVWEDLNSVGYREEGPVPDISSGLRYLLGPVVFSKFYAPIALLILGACAWLFFRQLGLAPVACGLGALATTLNSSFFSAACWGVAAHPIMLGMIFLALAAVLDTSSKLRWLRVALAGLAVGMGVNEAADIGAIFSLLVAVFVLYQAWTEDARKARRVLRAASRLAVLVVFAIFMAAQAVFALIETQIEGIAGAAQDTQTKQEHWDWATQWSLPKREILALAVPGLFGYRMTSPNGAAYWGAVGRDASWERYLAANRTGSEPKGFIRFTGGGIYCGVLVLLVGVWAAVNGFRKKDTLFNPPERQWLRFWFIVIAVSLLLSFGRFAPFYRWLYALPYFSTIRNPTKFLHVLSFALLVLFTCGLDGLARAYMQPATPRSKLKWAGLGAWWKNATTFEKRWVKGCAFALGLTQVAWVIYNGCRKDLIDYLGTVGFDEGSAPIIAAFSISQVGWFVLFLVLVAGAMTFTFSGAFAGRRSKWATLLLGLLVVVDLGRANLPWLVYFDYEEKYSSNPVLDALRDKPYEHRVGNLPVLDPSRDKMLFELYRREWAQHEFPFFNIQSLDIVQLPRQPADLQAYDKALSATDDTGWGIHIRRRWELTNTRYFLGNARLAQIANVQIDPEQRRFRTVLRFDIVPKPGVLKPETWKDLQIQQGPEGRFGLIEFAGVLPRAGLYSQWISMTNEQAILSELTSESFHPANTVLVKGEQLALPATGDTNAPAGKVEFESYASKDIVLQADASQSSVLLLNDRLDHYWNVFVDGQRSTMLRCNYLMRGVWLPPGSHHVRFRFQPPVWPVWVSFAANVIGLVLLGVLMAIGRPHEEVTQKSTEPVAKGRPEPQRARVKATA